MEKHIWENPKNYLFEITIKFKNIYYIHILTSITVIISIEAASFYINNFRTEKATAV